MGSGSGGKTDNSVVREVEAEVEEGTFAKTRRDGDRRGSG